MTGLTSEEVLSRRAEGRGNDEVASTSRPLTQILRTNVLTRFNAILGGLLLVIIVVGPFQDGLFGVVLVLNTAIGIGQEVRAKRVLDRLALLSAPKVRVWRDGTIVETRPDDLVVDDVVVISRGDQIPLDGTVVEGSLEIDESLLSGESDPVPGGPGRAVMSGSFVVSGSGAYRVEQVGDDSYAQHLAGEARRFTLATSELRDGVNRFLQVIQWALVPVGGLLIVRQLARRGNVADAVRSFVAGVSAMIPEGLILLISVAFFVAVVRLARKGVLVQELPAVEGLARVDVLCIDKTGTLTMGGMEVDDVETLGEGSDVEAALAALVAIESAPNPTLTAIAARYPPSDPWPAVWATPFSSDRRWSAADFGAHGVWVLGAPDVVGAGAAGGRVEELASAGRRVVLLARSERDALPRAVTPAALVCLSERLRPEAAEALERFHRDGVAVRVMSGDHPTTVSAIAVELGLVGAQCPVDASEATDDELAALVLDRSVFGRVAPQQKRAMVAALKQAGHTVAMTGDGVNDVLALKDADIGIAMGSGAAVTRGVAQLVLLDDSFAALAPVIAEGRRVIANVERVANLFITKTAYATLIALAIGISGAAYPFLPRHLTVISDLTIGIPAFVLAMRPNADPFRSGFVGRVLRFAVPCGVVVAAATLVVYALTQSAGRSLLERRTAATLVAAACSLVVLAALARPFDAFKAALVAAMAAGFVVLLAIDPVGSYFALRLPPAVQLFEIGAAVAVAAPLIEAVARRSRRDR